MKSSAPLFIVTVRIVLVPVTAELPTVNDVALAPVASFVDVAVHVVAASAAKIAALAVSVIVPVAAISLVGLNVSTRDVGVAPTPRAFTTALPQATDAALTVV
jgi:hypothetical protein